MEMLSKVENYHSNHLRNTKRRNKPRNSRSMGKRFRGQAVLSEEY